MSSKYKIGDLVTFSSFYGLGIVLAVEVSMAFYPEEDVYDVKVLWLDGSVFWCLDFTLNPFLNS